MAPEPIAPPQAPPEERPGGPPAGEGEEGAPVPARRRHGFLRAVLVQVLVLCVLAALAMGRPTEGNHAVFQGLAATFSGVLVLLVLSGLRTREILRAATVLLGTLGLLLLFVGHLRALGLAVLLAIPLGLLLGGAAARGGRAGKP